MRHPGINRAIPGAIIGFVLGEAIVMGIRTAQGLPAWDSGVALVLAPFTLMAGWMWGIGALNPKLSEHGEHHADETAIVPAEDGAVVPAQAAAHHDEEESPSSIFFTEIWKGASKHDPGLSSERGYIAMIARRRTIDWIRQRTRLPELAPLTEHMEIPAGVAAPGLMLDREILRHALESLSEETRRLFHLHFDRGMSHGEIAAETGLPLGSVKTALRRGLIEARVLLKRRLPVMTSEGGAP